MKSNAVYAGTRFVSDGKHDAFSYTRTSDVVPYTSGDTGAWNTTGTGTTDQSGFTNLTKSASSRSYRDTLDTTNGGHVTGSITGSFHFTETKDTHYDFDGSHTLDLNDPNAPDGKWVLTGGTGHTFSGEGTGQSYALDGSYAGGGAFLVAPELLQTWTIEGDIKENGFRNTSAGIQVNYVVTDGDWAEDSESPTVIFAEGMSFSDTAAGNYTRGDISGTTHRKEVIQSSDIQSLSLSGSGDEPTLVGTRDISDLYTVEDSYRADSVVFDGLSYEEFSESGSTDFKYTLNEQYNYDDDVLPFTPWIQTSGTATIKIVSEDSASQRILRCLCG